MLWFTDSSCDCWLNSTQNIIHQINVFRSYAVSHTLWHKNNSHHNCVCIQIAAQTWRVLSIFSYFPLRLSMPVFVLHMHFCHCPRLLFLCSFIPTDIPIMSLQFPLSPFTKPCIHPSLQLSLTHLLHPPLHPSRCLLLSYHWRRIH